MNKKTLQYGVGVAPHPIDGKPAVLVFFESCNTQEEALEMAGQAAEMMQEAFGGDVGRSQ